MTSSLKRVSIEPLPLLASQVGAVMVFAVIFMVSFLLLTAGVLDLAIRGASKSEQEHNASYVALQALRAYHQSKSSSDTGKLEDARRAAQNAARIAIVIGDPFIEGDQPEEIDLVWSGRGSSNEKNGYIMPGFWHFSPLYDENGKCVGAIPCPCTDGGSFAGPCFEAIDSHDDPLPKKPNAFQADLQLRPSSPMISLFGAFGIPAKAWFGSKATAAAMPIYTVLLIDLSRSSHAETHLPYVFSENTDILSVAESAYKLSSNKHASCPATPPCTETSGENRCLIEGGVVVGLYDYLWNQTAAQSSLMITPPQHPEKYYRQKRYKDDYTCHELSYREDGALKNEIYLIDTNRCQDGSCTLNCNSNQKCHWYYEGPEPLVTMLKGVNYTLQSFTERSIDGDLVGAIGFDRSIDIPERRFELVSVGSEEFNTLSRITNISNQTFDTISERLEQHLLFPRVNAELNLPQALKKAREMLMDKPLSASAQKMVILFSDGITTCRLNGSCGSYENYEASISESIGILEQDYVQDKISLHFMIMGGRVRPHYLTYRSELPSFFCMPQNEAETHTPPLMLVDYLNDSGSFTGESFLDPNRLYNAVSKTKGIWGPVRECYLKNHKCYNFQTEINLACKNGSPGTPIIKHPYTDDAGRLLFDPQGLSKEEQVRRYIKKIFGQTPYLVVE